MLERCLYAAIRQQRGWLRAASLHIGPTSGIPPSLALAPGRPNRARDYAFHGRGTTVQAIRHHSSSDDQSDKEGNADDQGLSEEILLFKAKFILPMRLVIRVKHANLAVVSLMVADSMLGLAPHVGLPYNYAAYASPVFWMVTGMVTSLTLLLARFATKVILRLSYYADESLLRVSTLDFFSRRCDFLVNCEDIVPFVEGRGQHPAALWHRLETYESKAKRYYCLEYSDIIEPDKLAELLWLPPEMGGAKERSWKRAQAAADKKAEDRERHQQQKQQR